MTSNGVKIGLLSYCMNKEGCSDMRNMSLVGPALYDANETLKEIQDLRQVCNLLF